MPEKPERSCFNKRFSPKSRARFVLLLCLFIFSALSLADYMASAASTPARPALYPPPAATETSTPFLPAISPSPRAPASRQCIWEGVEKIIAIGDLHGDYEHFITILKNEDIKLIDDRGHWIGGKTHLVQIGDVLDRGDKAKDIFNLIKSLEKEAAEAGGMVHMLIGNHEEINIMGYYFDYPDYWTIAQFLDFLPDDYKKKKEREFKKRTEDSGNIDAEWLKLMKEPGEGRDNYNMNFNWLYGRWIAEEHNAVIKINDTVFVHGGISEKYSTWKLKDINNLYYKEFQDHFRREDQVENYRAKIIFNPEGPLWYRDLAVWAEQPFASQVNKILANLGAKQIVIAHTPIIQDVPSRFGYKVWLVDTGISSAYRRAGGFLSALIIENGNLPHRWMPKY